MRQEVLEAEAIEEESVPVSDDSGEAARVRPLPAVRRDGEMALSNSEVRTMALAAAGGLVAGAATVAVVRAVRTGAAKTTRSGRRKRTERPVNVLASRSFLVDVHLLGDK
jgi:hypothetical protein